MKTALDDILATLEKQNLTLAKARAAYLLKESERKHFEALLIKSQEGKSHAERLVNAQASPQWLEFSRLLARLEATFEFHKMRMEILDKEFLAQYATLKSDEKLIKKQGV